MCSPWSSTDHLLIIYWSSLDCTFVSVGLHILPLDCTNWLDCTLKICPAAQPDRLQLVMHRCPISSCLYSMQLSPRTAVAMTKCFVFNLRIHIINNTHIHVAGMEQMISSCLQLNLFRHSLSLTDVCPTFLVANVHPPPDRVLVFVVLIRVLISALVGCSCCRVAASLLNFSTAGM